VRAVSYADLVTYLRDTYGDRGRVFTAHEKLLRDLLD